MHTVATEVMRVAIEREHPEFAEKLAELRAAREGDVVDVFGRRLVCNGVSPWLGQPTFEPAGG